MLSVEKVSLIVNFFSSFKTYLMEGEMRGGGMNCNEIYFIVMKMFSTINLTFHHFVKF